MNNKKLTEYYKKNIENANKENIELNLSKQTIEDIHFFISTEISNEIKENYEETFDNITDALIQLALNEYYYK